MKGDKDVCVYLIYKRSPFTIHKVGSYTYAILSTCAALQHVVSKTLKMFDCVKNYSTYTEDHLS